MRPHSVRLAFLAAVAAAATAAACREVSAPSEDPASTSYAPALGINLAGMTRTASGLYYQDLVTGTGARADSGDTVTAFYTGNLTSGHQFDTNVGGTAITFVLGMGGVIRGWDQGIGGIRAGGRRRLVIPPALGYGGTTSGLIPAGSVLVFDIRVTAVANSRADSLAAARVPAGAATVPLVR